MSRYCYIVNSTCAVSRYNYDRSKKTIKMHWNEMACNGACPGLAPIKDLSWEQCPAKTMTSLLILTGVVSTSGIYFCSISRICLRCRMPVCFYSYFLQMFFKSV